MGLSSTRMWLPSGEIWSCCGDGDASFEGQPSSIVASAWSVQDLVVVADQPRWGPASAAVPFSHAGESAGVIEVVIPTTWSGAPDDLSLLRSMARLIGQALVRVRMQRRLEEMAHRDYLTGLPNRRLLLSRLASAMSAARPGHPLGLLFVDLDGFKEVNNRYGHLAGDQVLREIGNRLRGSARTADVVARLGGDEFVVFRSGADEDATARMAEHVRSSISIPVRLASGEVAVGASVGELVVRAPFAASSPESLLAAADAAMYARKRRTPARGNATE